jgi:hypothetical protein
MAGLVARMEQVVMGLQPQPQQHTVLNKPNMYKVGQNFQHWLAKFDGYVQQVNIPLENRKAVLIHFLDNESAYKAVSAMSLAPGMGYGEYCERLSARFARYRTAADAKMVFQSREQLASETAEEFVEYLTELGRDAFPDPVYNDVSRAEQVFERFRHGVRTPDDVRERLFTDRPDGVQAALQLVQNVERGRKQLEASGHRSGAKLHVTREEVENVIHQTSAIRLAGPVRTSSSTGATGSSPVCMWCGERGHYAVRCPAREAPSVYQQRTLKCFVCGGSHFARDCSSRQQPFLAAPRGGNAWSRSGQFNPVACYQCGGPHFQRECPNTNGQGNSNGWSSLDGNRSAAFQRRQ